MNWLHRNNPFDDDRCGYSSWGCDQGERVYGYGCSSGYDSYAGSDYATSSHATSTAPTQSTGYGYGSEPAANDSNYAEQASYSRHNCYGEQPFYGEAETLFRTTSSAYDNRAVTTTSLAESVLADAEATETSEEVLVKIRGAVVHLVDDQESPLLAEGDFAVVRIAQQGNGIVALVRVGDALRWPLTKDEAAVKLDSTHYFFTLRVPHPVDDMDRETSGGASQESLTYGVTFSVTGESRTLSSLDAILAQYSNFATPQILSDDRERDEFEGAFGYGHGYGYGKPVVRLHPLQITQGNESHEINESNERSDDALFWSTMAPNVDDYNSDLAKTMAKGTGNLIKGIFWLRDSTVAQLENSSMYVRERVKPNEKPSNISPHTLRNLKRVMNMSIATEQVARSVLEGVVKAAAFFSGALMRSEAGRKFFQLLPGEVAMVSMEAFARVFDAVEKAGTDVMQSTAMFTQDVVTHRYGEEAGEVTESTLSTAGHVFATAWTVTKVRSALNPVKYRPTKTGMLKAAARAVVAGGRPT